MIIDAHSADSPMRPGYESQVGDEIWIHRVSLWNGDVLHLHMGKTSHDAFRSNMLADEIDTVIEGTLKDVTSENQD